MEVIEKKPRITFNEIPAGMYAAMRNTENYLHECGLSSTLIHLIKVRSSQINKCGFCLDMHHKDSIKEGETFQRLYLLPAWEESPCYTEAEKATLHLTEVLTQISEYDSDAIDEAYQRMTDHFSKEEIANIVLAICQINSWNRIAITFGNIPGSYKN